MQKTSIDRVTSASNQKALLDFYRQTGQLRPDVGQGNPRVPSTEVRDTTRHVQPDLEHQEWNLWKPAMDLRPPTMPPPKDENWFSGFWDSAVGKAIWDGLSKLGSLVKMDPKTVGYIMAGTFGVLLVIVLI